MLVLGPSRNGIVVTILHYAEVETLMVGERTGKSKGTVQDSCKST